VHPQAGRLRYAHAGLSRNSSGAWSWQCSGCWCAGAFEADARFQPLEPLAGSFSIDWGRLHGECVPEYGDDADRQLRKLRQVV
jgi:hypothetical protein